MIRRPPSSTLFPNTPPFPIWVPPSKETHATMSDTLTGSPALDAVTAALATVQDPEINRPLTELGMVKEIGRAHRLNSSHANISYAVFCLKKKKQINH